MFVWPVPAAVSFMFVSSTYNGVISGISIGSVWIMVLSSLSYSSVYNYIKFFNERIRSSIFSFLCRLHQSENPLFVNYFHSYIHLEARCTHLEIPIVHIILYCIFTFFF